MPRSRLPCCILRLRENQKFAAPLSRVGSWDFRQIRCRVFTWTEYNQKVVQVLAPLLVTSTHHPSGETSMAGTSPATTAGAVQLFRRVSLSQRLCAKPAIPRLRRLTSPWIRACAGMTPLSMSLKRKASLDPRVRGDDDSRPLFIGNRSRHSHAALAQPSPAFFICNSASASSASSLVTLSRSVENSDFPSTH